MFVAVKKLQNEGITSEKRLTEAQMVNINVNFENLELIMRSSTLKSLENNELDKLAETTGVVLIAFGDVVDISFRLMKLT